MEAVKRQLTLSELKRIWRANRPSVPSDAYMRFYLLGMIHGVQSNYRMPKK